MDNRSVLAVLIYLINYYEQIIEDSIDESKYTALVIVESLESLRKYWENDKLNKARSFGEIELIEVKSTLEFLVLDIKNALQRAQPKKKIQKYEQIQYAIDFILCNYSFLTHKEMHELIDKEVNRVIKKNPHVTHINILLRVKSGAHAVIEYINLNPKMP